MADVRVHTGTVTYESGMKRPAAWVETRIKLKLPGKELISGLGSKYFRYDILGDDDTSGTRPVGLPDRLFRRELLAICREEFECWGWHWDTWSYELSDNRREAAQGWLDELVRDAVPGIEEEGTYVETALALRPEWFNLVEALGSKYLRFADTDWRSRPTELPHNMTGRQVLAAFREEMESWGTSMATWTDAVPDGATRAAHRWLKELIADTFPEMKEYMT